MKKVTTAQKDVNEAKALLLRLENEIVQVRQYHELCILRLRFLECDEVEKRNQSTLKTLSREYDAAQRDKKNIQGNVARLRAEIDKLQQHLNHAKECENEALRKIDLNANAMHECHNQLVDSKKARELAEKTLRVKESNATNIKPGVLRRLLNKLPTQKSH